MSTMSICAAASSRSRKRCRLIGKGGSIVVTGSVGAIVAVPGNVIYAAAKAGLRAVTRTLAAELVGQGIRVNHGQPRPDRHPDHHPAPAAVTAEQVEGMKDLMAGVVPMKRMGTSEENRARGAVPGGGRGKLHHGHRHVCRWGGMRGALSL